MHNPDSREKEVKFYLANPVLLPAKLKDAGAVESQPRVHEWNLRFDTADHRLSSAGQVLRLRQDAKTRLTFKGSPSIDSQVADRQEIEVEVADFDAARRILIALGYQLMVVYEKYRTTWSWQGCEVTLDEMPYGAFCEVEGVDADAIQQAAGLLGLNWERRILASYLAIFSQLQTIGKCNAQNLVYADFDGMEITLEDLALINIHPADA